LFAYAVPPTTPQPARTLRQRTWQARIADLLRASSVKRTHAEATMTPIRAALSAVAIAATNHALAEILARFDGHADLYVRRDADRPDHQCRHGRLQSIAGRSGGRVMAFGPRQVWTPLAWAKKSATTSTCPWHLPMTDARSRH